MLVSNLDLVVCITSEISKLLGEGALFLGESLGLFGERVDLGFEGVGLPETVHVLHHGVQFGVVVSQLVQLVSQLRRLVLTICLLLLTQHQFLHEVLKQTTTMTCIYTIVPTSVLYTIYDDYTKNTRNPQFVTRTTCYTEMPPLLYE